MPTRAFPSVYRELGGLGFQWFKVHRYWFAVEETVDGKVIANIVYDGADIPFRV